MLRPCQRLVIHSYNVTFNALGQAFENPFSKLLCLKFYITAGTSADNVNVLYSVGVCIFNSQTVSVVYTAKVW